MEGGSTNISDSISYPEGCNKNNCVIIGSILQNTNSNLKDWSSGNSFDSSAYIKGGLVHVVTLSDDYITISAKNINITDGNTPIIPIIQANFNYKIIIMKIS